ncbi:MAG: CHC2 zinc finger domain-containing protein [Dehalococcoidia bacterium]|nr:CHC2 zinc finger domain-containing protein [Dehalococcoidia bacterium]
MTTRGMIKTTILDLLTEDGIVTIHKATTNGGEYVGPCPWCHGTDRFRVWPEQGRYWCRACNRSGDTIQYLRDFRKLSYRQACDLLGRMPEAKPHGQRQQYSAWVPKETRKPEKPWQERMKQFVDSAVDGLHKDSEGMAACFLRQKRFLTDDTIEKYRLGWNQHSAYILTEELALEGYGRCQVWLPDGVIIPYFNEDGLMRVRVRRFEGEPRYYIVPGSSTTPFLLRGSRSGAVVIVESELDGILLHQECGDLADVLALGSASIRPDTPVREYLAHCSSILISLDSDEAGAKESWGWWKKQYPTARRWPIIRGKDASEAMGNGIDLRLWVLAATPTVAN